MRWTEILLVKHCPLTSIQSFREKQISNVWQTMFDLLIGTLRFVATVIKDHCKNVNSDGNSLVLIFCCIDSHCRMIVKSIPENREFMTECNCRQLVENTVDQKNGLSISQKSRERRRGRKSSQKNAPCW